MRKIRKYFLILCLLGIGTGFFSLIYFQTLLPNAEIYDVQFNVEGKTIDATVYEPNIGYQQKINQINSSTNERPLVILVHGFAMSKEFMLSFSIELARRGVSTISISMPGHGNSEGPYYFTEVTPIAISAAIDFMIKNSKYPINISRIGAIGHSMGGQSVIRAATNDSRIKSTVAIAAPNGDSSVFERNERYQLEFIDETVDSYPNKTTPNNLLFVVGAQDELCYEPDARKIMGAATGLAPEEVELEKTYFQNFSMGTSRKLLIFPLMDHLTEVYSPRSLSSIMDWVALSFLINSSDFSKNLDYVSHWRPILIFFGLSSSLFIFIPLSSYISEKFGIKNRLKNDSENEMDSKSNVKIFGFYCVILGIIPGIIGLLIKMDLSMQSSIMPNAMIPVIFLSGVLGLISILIGQKLRKVEFLSFKSQISEDLTDIKSNRNDQKYFASIMLLFLVCVYLIQFFWSEGIFSIYITLERRISFIVCFLMLIPLSLVDNVILRRKYYKQMISKRFNLKNYVFFSTKTSFIKSLPLAISLAISIRAPFFTGLLESFIFLFIIFFSAFLLFETITINWIYLWDGKIWTGSLMAALIFALVLNVAFPIVN
jgi:pimeloyl-ACP methyl ester carboxylesterase